MKEKKPAVMGEGPIPATVMLVGQNPGKEELKQGRPFVGRAGKYLDEALMKSGIDRNRLYITSVVKEGTPNNRKPAAAEVAYWLPLLEKEIKKVRPDIIVLMGKTAEETPRFDGVEYLITCHPAAAMRFPQMRRRFEADMRTLKRKIEECR